MPFADQERRKEYDRLAASADALMTPIGETLSLHTRWTDGMAHLRALR